MTRLIDADALEKAIYEWMPKDQSTWMDSDIPPIENLVVSIMMTIQEQPTVDAIPISYFAEAAYITRQSLRMPERSEQSKKALKEESRLMLSWINHYRYETENVPDAMFKAWTEDDLIGKLPVIRCEDCKHWPMNQLRHVPLKGEPMPNMWSYIHCEGMDARDFCSKAERKEE